MATYDNAWLLAKCKLFAKRPTTDATTTDADWYGLLSLAQQDAYVDIAARCPAALVRVPTALTAAGDNKTFTFGTDSNGHAVVPWGHARIYPSLTAIPHAPWREGVDYAFEGTRIRIPNDATYGSTLYGQWVDTPADITASVQPTLTAPARILLVYKAVELWAAEGALRPALSQDMERRYNKALAQWLLAWRTTPGSALSSGLYTAMGVATESGGLVDGSGASILWD